MKHRKPHLYWVVMIGIFFTCFQLSAQSPYKLADNHELIVAGTSTLHDWTMTSNEANGKARMLIEGGQLKEIASLEISMPVKTLKSGKRQMDNNAYEALDANKHPNAVFTLDSVEDISASTVKAYGSLNIAGNKSMVQLTVDYQLNGNAVSFNGNTDTSFSAFQVSAPTAVFGTIKTGEDLTLSFQVEFVPNN